MWCVILLFIAYLSWIKHEQTNLSVTIRFVKDHSSPTICLLHPLFTVSIIGLKFQLFFSKKIVKKWIVKRHQKSIFKCFTQWARSGQGVDKKRPSSLYCKFNIHMIKCIIVNTGFRCVCVNLTYSTLRERFRDFPPFDVLSGWLRHVTKCEHSDWLKHEHNKRRKILVNVK